VFNYPANWYQKLTSALDKIFRPTLLHWKCPKYMEVLKIEIIVIERITFYFLTHVETLLQDSFYI